MNDELKATNALSDKAKRNYPPISPLLQDPDLILEIIHHAQQAFNGIAFNNDPANFPLPEKKEDRIKQITNLYGIEPSDIDVIMGDKPGQHKTRFEEMRLEND